MSQSAESYVPVPTLASGTPIRNLLVFEFQPATGTYVQVQTEVVAAADPMTGMTVRLATSEQADDIVSLLRANLRANVAMLNELAGRETNYEVDDFMRDDEDG